MKNLFTLTFTLIAYVASAQTSTRTQASTKIVQRNICLERGHTPIYTANVKTKRTPYTIDTKDSTVTVYPAPYAATGKCSRCGETINNDGKDIRVTTWRRSTTKPGNANIDLVSPSKSANLDDNKKIATLKNDTLFVHKRVFPFTTIREQIKSKKDTVVYYKNEPVRFRTAVFDYAYFFVGKNGKAIY